MALEYRKFRDVNLSDTFFDSLKEDYPEFEDWFVRKGNEKAYVSFNEHNLIDGFLYLKVEDEALSDCTPPYSKKLRIKCGTFKIDAHGTKLGERFVRKIFDFASLGDADEIYVTIFDKHQGLINLLTRYGFRLISRKNKETLSGQEGVYLKDFIWRD
ncbi:GNAT family N-acetyltransferase [Klebsiella oxytoca]|uniref:GNAT family N-acetyltransferase n=1 Tax=Klebsiella oxytoca TaxID=571 RepID=UPI00163C3919|nr:GNAT family N-acetyltransferase [Klebsiella oxytoca]ELT9681866.1 GNAT family N-acetyltransferase [Klebsiella oxytoca]ELT9975486.1 GNAT family N-acetyltransferase [Klebsiella oxytoca]MBL6085496.1 GNAT family N-acetyltransferase [Klebsiella oxytoca]MBL6252117.1 GNAT family N-acetyltransferase [Klebsiella oxytoca]MBL6269522.1 GNAT family N-acetyltransferase [Klebsiella oxytoca]